MVDIVLRDSLFNELADCLTRLEFWIDPPMEYIKKLFQWHQLALQPTDITAPDFESLSSETIIVSESEEKIKSDRHFLNSLYYVEDRLFTSHTPIDKLKVVQAHIANLEGKYGESLIKELGQIYEPYTAILYKKEEYWSRKMLRRDAQPDFVRKIFPPQERQNDNQESIQQNIEQLKRVEELFSKQVYWNGSLSDFVHVMDKLGSEGYLKRKDIDTRMAESFEHKPKGKDVVRKLTPEKIKARRRDINSKKSGHNPSDEIRKTTDAIFNTMPSKKR